MTRIPWRRLAALLVVLAVAAIGWRLNGAEGAFVAVAAVIGFMVAGAIVCGVLVVAGMFWAFANDSGQPFWKNKPPEKPPN